MSLIENAEPEPIFNRLTEEGDLPLLAAQILESIGERVPFDPAICVLGNSVRVFSCDGFPEERMRQLKNRFEAYPNRLREVAQKRELPHSVVFDDGAVAYLVPLVHDRVMEGVLCLYRASADCHELLLRQVNSLGPLCASAAAALVRTMEKEAERGDSQPANRALDRRPRQSEASSFVVSRLLRNLAHDLRTPATVVRGYLRMVLDGRTGPISSAQRECLSIAARSAADLAALGELAENAAAVISRSEIQILDFRDLWLSACRSNRTKILAARLAITDRIPGTSVPVCGDRAALESILDRVLAAAVLGLEGGELHAELKEEAESAILRISSPSPQKADEESRQELFRNVQKFLSLHGGSLTSAIKKEGEKTMITISLPSCGL